MIEFDARIARMLDDAYQGSDFTKRRMQNFDALQLQYGEAVADIGCGPGLLTTEIARAVGEDGSVIGIDPSEEMRKTAAGRCAGRSNIRIVEGDANSLPMTDGSVDKAVAIQVYEYLDDISAALREAGRVLRPEGRLVIGDLHWDSLVWFSEQPERMARVLKAWDGHLVERCVPAMLPSLMREADFAVESVMPLTTCDTTLRSDGLANMMLHLIEAYIAKKPEFGQSEARSWAEEQQELAAEGRFFFAFTHFTVVGRNLRSQ